MQKTLKTLIYCCLILMLNLPWLSLTCLAENYHAHRGETLLSIAEKTQASVPHLSKEQWLFLIWEYNQEAFQADHNTLSPTETQLFLPQGDQIIPPDQEQAQAFVQTLKTDASLYSTSSQSDTTNQSLNATTQQSSVAQEPKESTSNISTDVSLANGDSPYQAAPRSESQNLADTQSNLATDSPLSIANDTESTDTPPHLMADSAFESAASRDHTHHLESSSTSPEQTASLTTFHDTQGSDQAPLIQSSENLQPVLTNTTVPTNTDEINQPYSTSSHSSAHVNQATTTSGLSLITLNMSQSFASLQAHMNQWFNHPDQSHSLAQLLPFVLMFVGSTLLLIALKLILKKPTSSLNHTSDSYEQTNSTDIMRASDLYATSDQSDFDLFSSQDGPQVKLNLALAYIKMKDFDHAKLILKEIMSKPHECPGTILRRAEKLAKQL